MDNSITAAVSAKTPNKKVTFRGELALIVAILINSFSVVLMLYSDAGISAISSVPYAFSLVFPKLTLGTWTYIFQGTLILSLMIMRKKFVPTYLRCRLRLQHALRHQQGMD